jgi:hypothetical protein
MELLAEARWLRKVQLRVFRYRNLDNSQPFVSPDAAPPLLMSGIVYTRLPEATIAVEAPERITNKTTMV